MTTVRIEGMDDIIRKLERLQKMHIVVKPALVESLALLHDYIAEAPTKDGTAFSRLATPRQKRAYWAKVSKGIISHGAGGYRRTNTILRKWVTRIERVAGGLRGILGNNADGAIFVQGDRQQPFHKASGWRTTDQTVKKNSEKIVRIFQKYIKREVNR